MSHILFNTTFKVDTAASEKWLLFMRNVHIPMAMESQCFTEYKLLRITGDDNEDGITYALQFLAPELKSLMEYHAIYDAALQRQLVSEFNGRYADFTTIMEVIEQT